MTKTRLLPVLASATGIASAVALGLALLPGSGQATKPAAKTETIRAYSEVVSMKVTRADGTVIAKPPFPEGAAGDVLEINSVDYRGTKAKHGNRAIGTDYLRCTFPDAGAPDCRSFVALGGSLLVFEGSPGTIVNGTGRYQGATGEVVSSKEVGTGSDIVVRVNRK